MLKILTLVILLSVGLITACGNPTKCAEHANFMGDHPRHDRIPKIVDAGIMDCKDWAWDKQFGDRPDSPNSDRDHYCQMAFERNIYEKCMSWGISSPWR